MKTSKKALSLITLLTCFALTACSSTEPNNLTAEQDAKPKKKKTCIAGERTGSRLAKRC